MNHNERVEMKLCEMLADRPGFVGELAMALRRHIAKLAPDSTELLYKTYAVSDVFTYTGKLGQAFIHIATYSQHVNLGFNQGAKLDDPEQILEGTGKLIRHLRIDNIDAVQEKSVSDLITSAIELGCQMALAAGGKQSQTFEVKTK